MSDTMFATLIGKIQNAGESPQIHVPDDWMQGRTVYGGLVAALALQSMRAHVPLERKVRTLFVSFIGPLDAKPFYIQTGQLRSGKSVTTVESRVLQNDAICCTALGSFGADRDSRIRIPAAASTMTWSLGFVHLDRMTCSENDWWAYHCTVDSAERGYVHERSTIWDPEGHLAVYSHQTNTVFA
jgi:acyl-CoA thioesterase